MSAIFVFLCALLFGHPPAGGPGLDPPGSEPTGVQINGNVKIRSPGAR